MDNRPAGGLIWHPGISHKTRPGLTPRSFRSGISASWQMICYCSALALDIVMKLKGKQHALRNGAKKIGFYDDDFDLVQNNGRVTLPIGTGSIHLTRKQLKVLFFLASSLFVAFLVGRK